MNGRERITRLMRGKTIDRIALTTLIDGPGAGTRQDWPDQYRDMETLEFHKKLGYDIFCFGNYGLKKRIVHPYAVHWGGAYSFEWTGDGAYVEKRTIGGRTITSIAKGHPIKYPIETAEDLKTLVAFYEAGEFKVLSGLELEQCRQSLRDINADIGQDGIYTAVIQPSGVQHLIEYECGVENFYYLLNDEQELVERAIEAIQNIRRKEYRALIEHMDSELVIPVENTSTLLTSPDIYRRYSLAHIREYTEIAHQYGKLSVIHMCGNLRGLLHEFKAAGIDGIHTLTPPPVGDCPYEDALNILGEDLLVITGFDNVEIHHPNATRESIDELVKTTLTPRIKNARFIYAVGADGIATPVWKFEAVRNAVEKYGKI